MKLLLSSSLRILLLMLALEKDFSDISSFICSLSLISFASVTFTTFQFDLSLLLLDLELRFGTDLFRSLEFS